MNAIIVSTIQRRINDTGGGTPSVIISSNAVAGQEGAFTMTAIFSRAVTGFTTDDITYSNCFLSNFSTSDNTVYTCTVTPKGVSDDISLSIGANVCTQGNTASNVLTITQWNPVSVFGSNLDMELNFRTTLGKTLSGLENSILGNTTAEGAGAVAWTSLASGGNTVKFSGDWSYAQGLCGLETADKTGRRYLHDGTNFEIWVRVRLEAAGVAYSVHLSQNNNGTSAKRGITAVINVSNTNVATLAFNVTNGGSVVYNNGSIALTTVPAGGSYYTLRITKTGSGLGVGAATYSVFLDGVSKLSATNTGAITGTADSSDNLTIYRTSSTAFAYSSRCLIKDILFIKTSLTAGQVTSLTNYLALGRETPGSGTTRYLFVLYGQSLIDGSTPSSNPPSYLRDPLNAKIFNPTYAVTYSITNTFETLDYGVNQGYNSLTYYGPNLSLAYEASQLLGSQVYICQCAKGGIPWYNQAGTDTTWNTANASGMPRNAVQFQWVEQILRIHKYQLNSTMKIFLYINEGQTDCISTNPDAVGATQADKNAAVQASVKTALTNFLKKFIDDTQAAGVSTTNLVIQIGRIVSTFNPSTPNYTQYVNAAIDDVAANFPTDNPTYVGDYQAIFTLNNDYMDISGDGTHPNDASQVEQGVRANNGFVPYL